MGSEASTSKYDWETLEQLDRPLWLLAILLILVLGAGLLSLMFPIILSMGAELLLKAPKRAFWGIYLLLVMTLVYLLQKQARQRRLKRELFEAKTGLAMAQSEAAIVESTDDAIFGKTLDGYILSWNQGAENLYGYTTDEIKGRHISLLVPAERLEKLRLNLEDFRQGKSIKRYQTVSIRKDGAQIPVTLTISPVRDSNGIVIGSATIARDLSQRLEAENQLRQAHERLQVSLAEVERRNQLLDLFGQLTVLLGSTQVPEEGYALVADFAPKIFPSDSGALYVLNASRTFMETFGVWGDPIASEVVFSPDDCWGLRLGKAHLSEKGTQASQICRHLTKSAMVDSLCVPVVAQGEVFALFYLQICEHLQDEGHDSHVKILQSKRRLAITFAERISVSLANLRLRDQLRLQSIRDQLTGLFNRSYLNETVEREVSRASRKQSTVGIIMIDIDHFKEFNDTHGHDAGDVLLREVGSFLNNQSRKQDIACRYGGEEFTLVLPDASLEDTARRAEEIRVQGSKIHVMHYGQQLGPIKFSLGVSAFPKHGSTPVDILKAADNALYRAKGEGRDRVVVD